MSVQNLQETSIMLSFSILPDPRKNRNQVYSLFDIVTVAILAVLCGDDCKIQKDNGAENFSVIRRAILNLLKADKKTKAGIKNKRSKAGWDKDYMLSILRMEC